jgi:hypothetical protein
MELLMAVEMYQDQVAFGVRSPYSPWFAMMDMQFFIVEERHSTLPADTMLAERQSSFSRIEPSSFGVGASFPVVAQPWVIR